MTFVERPSTWHHGVWQMRPALLGWQYRIRIYGLTWEPWSFRFGSREHVRAVVRAELGQGFTEEPYDPRAVES